jgi:hypothetical protein
MATKIIHKKSSVASSIPAAGDLEPGEIAVNLADQKLYSKTTGGTVIELAHAGAGSGMSFSVKTANYTLSANEGVIADTSGGAFTITLPASPSAGDTVVIADGNNWNTTNLVVGRNGSTIEGDAADMDMDIGGASVQFTYDGSTWQLYTTVGADADQFAAAAAKVTGIEASADVTDTANVTAAGALMDSEVTNLAQVKAFDSSDYATAAQGVLADSALQEVVSDTTPQLGGNLDGNGYNITLDAGNSFAIGSFNVNTAPSFAGGNVSAITSQGNMTFGVSEANHDVIFQTLGSSSSLSNAIVANGGGGVDLYYDGSKKWESTSTGVEITGVVTATSYSDTVFTITGTTPALDPANGGIQTWTLSGASTPTDSFSDGESITLMIDDGTAFAITWPTMQWAGGSAPDLPTTGYALVVLWKVGSTLYGASGGDMS